MDGTSRILIVDDNETNTQVVAKALKGPEYEADIAGSGAEALEKVEGGDYDLILLDIMMPDMDGFEVCRRLKENREIPVVFLTARTDLESVSWAFECGGNDFISKPFQILELKARVDTQLRLKRQMEQVESVSNERKQLLHILCHDLANPIAAASAVVSLLEEDPDYFEEGKTLLRTSLQNSAEIIHFVRKIRQLERSETALEMKYENLLSMIEESFTMLSHLWKAKSQTVGIDVDPELQVYVDRTSFVGTVLNNLLSNAVKFSPPGAEILVAAFPLADSGEMIEVSVRDEGIGIPDEMIDDIFSLSKPSSRPGTDGETGTGYGMPLVKRFVEAYGGTISIGSGEGGTVVTCILKSRG